MSNRKINHKEVEKLCVRLIIYADICRKALRPKYAGEVSWFFKDIHDRLVKMFHLNPGRRDFEQYFGEIYKEVAELSSKEDKGASDAC